MERRRRVTLLLVVVLLVALTEEVQGAKVHRSMSAVRRRLREAQGQKLQASPPNLGNWPSKDPSEAARVVEPMKNSNAMPILPHIDVFYLPDGCLSNTSKFACSGNGKCRSAIGNFFGVNTAQMATKKSCYCYSGWFGLACQLKLSNFTLSEKLKLTQAGILTQVPGTMTFESTSLQTVRHAFFLKRYKQKFPTAAHAGENTDAGTVPDLDQPGPHTDLDEWSSPKIEVLMPGARMMHDYVTERKHIMEDMLEKRRHPHPAPLSPKPAKALYTNWKGQDLVGPGIQAGQPEYRPGVEKKEDKLLYTMDQMVGKTDKYGAPLKIPSEKVEIHPDATQEHPVVDFNK